MGWKQDCGAGSGRSSSGDGGDERERERDERRREAGMEECSVFLEGLRKGRKQGRRKGMFDWSQSRSQSLTVSQSRQGRRGVQS